MASLKGFQRSAFIRLCVCTLLLWKAIGCTLAQADQFPFDIPNGGFSESIGMSTREMLESDFPQIVIRASSHADLLKGTRDQAAHVAPLPLVTPIEVPTSFLAKRVLTDFREYSLFIVDTVATTDLTAYSRRDLIARYFTTNSLFTIGTFPDHDYRYAEDFRDYLLEVVTNNFFNQSAWSRFGAQAIVLKSKTQIEWIRSLTTFMILREIFEPEVLAEKGVRSEALRSAFIKMAADKQVQDIVWSTSLSNLTLAQRWLSRRNPPRFFAPLRPKLQEQWCKLVFGS